MKLSSIEKRAGSIDLCADGGGMQLLFTLDIGDDALLVLCREVVCALLQRVDEEWDRVGLEVLSIAHLVQVLGQFLRRALQVVC